LRLSLIDEGAPLIVWHFQLRANPQERRGIYRKPRKEILLIAIVLVGTAVPVPGGNLNNAGHSADLLFIGRRKGLGERYLVPHDQAKGLSWRRFAEVQGMINRDQYAQQAE
jgi:heme oxygenase